eukprot:15339424-Ditylum_brightwellii.AAC.2
MTLEILRDNGKLLSQWRGSSFMPSVDTTNGEKCQYCSKHAWRLKRASVPVLIQDQGNCGHCHGVLK